MALDRDTEVRHLIQADVCIADAKSRIAGQERLLEQLRRDRHDTKDDERLLLTMNDTLKIMQAHRNLIVDALAEIDAGLI